MRSYIPYLGTRDKYISVISKELRIPEGRVGSTLELLEEFSFAEGIDSIDDLKEGMMLTCIVTNVTNFGAFVDIGVHQDGLVHINQLSDKFVKNPLDVVKVHQRVVVRVLNVDIERRRIGLSMKNAGVTRDS